MRTVALGILLAWLLAGCLSDAPDDHEAPEPSTTGPDLTQVVVAQFDTGTNPWHPCMARAGTAADAAIPGLPAHDVLELTWEDEYDGSLEASQPELDAIQPETLYYVNGTKLLFRGQPDELVDYYPHGSQASSQVVCEEYGLAPDAWLLVQNWYLYWTDAPAHMDWVAAQDWIDIVHLNIQSSPSIVSGAHTESIHKLVDSGKFVVVAAGNGVGGGGANYPMEMSPYNSVGGSLIAGSMDNNGYTTYSNLNPHVAMDGCGTRAAEPYGFEETSFGGTSSASPRTTGYVAELLRQVRLAFQDALVEGPDLVNLAEGAAPDAGPLADGALTVAEMHEVVRKTADPRPHSSEYDGSSCLTTIPDVPTSSYSFYVKAGYGKISEATLPDALDVLTGAVAMPERPWADMWYEQSERLRETWWSLPVG